MTGLAIFIIVYFVGPALLIWACWTGEEGDSRGWGFGRRKGTR
jgi:hypothetical protein